MKENMVEIESVEKKVPVRAELGMSLVEIMIVLTIISMIVGGAAFVGFRELEKAKIKETGNLIRTVSQAVHTWSSDYGSGKSCPDSLSELATTKILTKSPKDAWGQEFDYKCGGDSKGDEGFEIISRGKDNILGTKDDIRSFTIDEDTKIKPSK